jgi:hypothetical protein
MPGFFLAIRLSARRRRSVEPVGFETSPTNSNVNAALDIYAVTGDGQRFLILEPAGPQIAPPITVITNWTSLLKK